MKFILSMCLLQQPYNNLFCKLFKGIWKIKGVGENTEGGRGTKKERGRRVVQRCGETRKGPGK